MISTTAILQALLSAGRQFNDPKLIKVMVLSLVLAALVTGPFFLFFLAISALLELALPSSLELPWLGQVGFLGVFTTGLISKTSWIFWTYVMSPIAVAIIGIFLERIVNAVEARHYPDLPPVQNQSFPRMLGYGVRFLFLMLGVSLAALILSFFSGIFAPLVFVAANGYLIGREYYEMVALRRTSPADAKRLTGKHMPTLWLMGSGLALFLTVPVVNLFVPILGVAAYTHLFHRLPR